MSAYNLTSNIPDFDLLNELKEVNHKELNTLEKILLHQIAS
ncbi:hypothetical protein N8768_02460 [Flavobacteriaceae bacterium]|jgi:hypothetical protein|nr:hypothetical protein [Flavobacteriaceae bacterium]